jgi:hypothetical protein
MSLDDLDPAAAFTPLAPPANGLALLRARLQRERRRQSGVRFVLAGAVAAALVLVWIGLPPSQRPARRLIEGAGEEHYPSLAARGLAAVPSEPVTMLTASEGGPPLRLRRVPVASPTIVFYLARSDRSDQP